MPKKRLFTISLLCLICAGAVSIATAQNDESFGRFFSDFQKAVSAGDKEKVVSMIDFEHFTWEENEGLRQVKTKEAFLKSYNRIFTSTIRDKIATGKPIKVDDNAYFINWHTKKLDYSLDFTRNQSGSFRFLGLTVGPY